MVPFLFPLLLLVLFCPFHDLLDPLPVLGPVGEKRQFALE
jgi:hypothetical protein